MKVDLAPELIAALDEAVRAGRASSRERFVEDAVRRHLAASEREAIDAQFRQMADDDEYRRAAGQIADEFSVADWEAFRSAEPAS